MNTLFKVRLSRISTKIPFIKIYQLTTSIHYKYDPLNSCEL